MKNKVTISKTKSGYYTVIIRDEKDKLVHRQSTESIEKAEAVASKYRYYSRREAVFLAALGPCGK